VSGRVSRGRFTRLSRDLTAARCRKTLLIDAAKGYRWSSEARTPSRPELPAASGARRPDQAGDGRPHRQVSSSDELEQAAAERVDDGGTSCLEAGRSGRGSLMERDAATLGDTDHHLQR
jgi:hypothetical protein